MYTSFFGLNEKPFSITPDPRYLFMSERHGEALAHLVYGVTESGGFIQLTGEVGTGKTTLVRTLLLNRMPDNADVAVILNPQLSPLEFLASICEELGVERQNEPYSSKALIDALNRHLLAAHGAGRRTILVVDEAQNLARDVLEQVRLLTNLETSKQKLLQIILIGQPELRELLARNDLRQLAQRITGRYHLEPLSRDETARYIEHRLKVAGALGEVFDTAAKREVYRLSEGVPRLVNVICDRALLGAYAEETRRVGKRLVRRAAREVQGGPAPRGLPGWLIPAIGVPVALVVGASIWLLAGRADLTVPPDLAATPELTPTGGETGPGAAGETPSVPEAASAPASDPDETLDDQLRLAGDITYIGSAFSSLFELWGIPFDGDGAAACEQAADRGLACHRQRGSWSSLRQLDRPAILTLTDTRGEDHEVVLIALSGEVAELSIAGVTVTHPVRDVSELWFGEFQLLWQPRGPVTLAPGMNDPGVRWLRQSLAEIDERYRADPVDSPLFDTTLESRVREFQRDHRIDVDGFAGGQTQIIINSLLAFDERPRLLTARLARE